LDTIEDVVTKDTISELFKNKTLFYALFALIYGLQFGIRDNSPQDHKKLTRENNPPRAWPIASWLEVR